MQHFATSTRRLGCLLQMENYSRRMAGKSAFAVMRRITAGYPPDIRFPDCGFRALPLCLSQSRHIQAAYSQFSFDFKYLIKSADNFNNFLCLTVRTPETFLSSGPDHFLCLILQLLRFKAIKKSVLIVNSYAA